jgi:cystathionine beta-lyase/cystathionine gamma-synthase
LGVCSVYRDKKVVSVFVRFRAPLAHASIPEDKRKKLESQMIWIRLSVGIEDTDDLMTI